MDTTYTLLSALKGQQRQMDSVSNNLANVNTPGYKEDEVLFREHYNGFMGQDLESEQESFAHHEFITPATRGASSFVMPDMVSQKMGLGKFKATANPMDLALRTEGYFEVSTERGARYTRNGQFMQSPEGFLVTNSGDKVMGQKGPIQFKGKDFSVGSDGTILVDKKLVDVLKIVNFENPENLQRMGNSYWVPSHSSQKMMEMQNFAIDQGIIEGSNVDSVKEMVKMISVNRSYEASAKALKSVDELDQQSISIARV
ncbi:MAG: flagellar basal-body rod protein FlgF [Proteobacteria bacterium]|nr:flagellar basal-body rod protein FlgF [Pseudomonadota bacterium]